MENDGDVVGGLATALVNVASLTSAAVITALAVTKAYCLLTVGRCRCTRRMDGKTVIITGANSGVGKETARELCRRGARVILACRDMDKARLAASDIAKETGVRPVCMHLDLCSFESIRRFAQQILEQEQRLDVLINNAGKIATANKIETEDGFESTLQTNHLGHFLLSNLLLDLLKKSAPSRIVVVGSNMIWLAKIDRSNVDFAQSYDKMKVYNTTKLYNMLFVVELSRRLEGTGVTVNCCHPGVVRSNLSNRSGDLPARIANLIQKCFGKTPKEGAQTSVHLAISDEAGTVSGKYFADCRQAKTPRSAVDPESAEFLWQASETMTGLH